MAEANGTLVQYNRMRSEVATCAKIDEAKAIRDKAEALRAYAVQVNDSDMEEWVAEIKLRAQRRIGELSAALEKGHGTGKNGKIKSPPSGLLKSEALEAAGITKQTAHRCEQVAGIPEAEFEAVINDHKEKGKPVSADRVVKAATKKAKPAAPKAKAEPAFDIDADLKKIRDLIEKLWVNWTTPEDKAAARQFFKQTANEV